MIHPLPNAPTFDEFAAYLATFPQVAMPVRHFFTPGLYCREITIPEGTVAASMEHRTEHQFILSAGVVEVISSTEGAILLHAPHHGITKPGTRRLLRALTEVVWTTCHVTTETDVEKIGEAILVPTADPAREAWRLELPIALPQPSTDHLPPP